MIKLTTLLKEITEIYLMPGQATRHSAYDLADYGVRSMFKDKRSIEDFKTTAALLDAIKKVAKPAGSTNEFELYQIVYLGTPEYHLINVKADRPDLAFAGLIQVSDFSKADDYNLQAAYDIKALRVHWSNVAEEYRGKGVGKILYTLVYEYVNSKGFSLVSDDTLYEGSSGMWRKFMPEIASYFGIVLNEIILPISKEEVKNPEPIRTNSVTGFIAMENPPKIIRKLAHNVQGLSFSKGEYGTARIYRSVKDKLPMDTNKKKEMKFFNLVDEFDSITRLVKAMDNVNYILGLAGGIGNINKCKCLVFAFDDMMVAVKQVNDKLVVQTI